MKKVFFISAISIFAFIACNRYLKPDPNQAMQSNFQAADSIPTATAKDMIDHYLDSIVDHSPGSIIQQISLYNSDLFPILKPSKKKKPLTRMRFFAAAYLNNDPIVARRNLKTVLVQLKFHYNSDYIYYDIQSFGDGRLCPPPMGCSTE